MRVRRFLGRVPGLLMSTVGTAVLLCSAVPATAQSSDEFLRGVRGVVDLLGQGQANPADRRAGTGTIHTNPRQQEIIPPTPSVFPSRQALLEATRRGDLIALRQAPEGDKQQFRASLYAIVVNEYQVPPFGHACMNAFNRDVSDLFIELTNGWRSTLNDQPPSFFNGNTQEMGLAQRGIANVRSKWDSQRTACDGNAMGRIVPHPYKAALMDLLGLYNAALQDVVTREASRRRDNFAA